MSELTSKEIVKLITTTKPIILDVGCYDGRDSAKIAEEFEDCCVFCFEADKRSQKLFETRNGFNNKLILEPVALSNVHGEIDFHPSNSETRRHYSFQKEWSASSSIKKPKAHLDLFPDVNFEEKVRINSTTLDIWHKSNIDNDFLIDFIWADINGGEEEFILGGLETLNNYTKYLYIEFSDKELYEGQITKDQILELLPGFELLSIHNFRGNFGNLLLKNKFL